MPQKNSFEVHLKEAREAVGMSQQRLAKIAHATQAYISQLESGKRLPSLETAAILAEALGKPCETIWVHKSKKRRKTP